MKKICLFYLFFLFWYTHASFKIDLPVQYDTLSNGLKIILIEDKTVPVVSCRLYYFMGSMYEGPGTTGLSHMYEHMMFKGTKRLGTFDYQKEIPFMKSMDSLDNIIVERRKKRFDDSDSLILSLKKQILSLLDQQRQYIKNNEVWELYQNNGGTELNAWTSDDITAYIVTLPENKTELFFWIESDRMQNPILREFYSERDVVAEERKMRVENKPVNNYYEHLFAQFYIAHPYRLPTIGWMSDIQGYTRQKMEDHVKRYYTPDNAIIILNGNIDSKKCREQIEHYFGSIPRSSIPKQIVVTREPKVIGEKRFTVYDNVEPRIDILFATPGYPQSDIYVLDIVESLFSGRGGRLYRTLVNDMKLCTSVGASNEYRFYNGYFHIYANLKAGTDPSLVEQTIFEEINKLKLEKPSEREFTQIKNSIQKSFIEKLRDLEYISDQLAYFENLHSWRDLLEYPSKIESVSLDSVSGVVSKYFTKDKKTIGLLLNK